MRGSLTTHLRALPPIPDEWHDRSCYGCGKLIPETYPAEVVSVTEFVSALHRQTHWHSNCYTLEQFKRYQMGQAIGAEILSRCTPGAQR